MFWMRRKKLWESAVVVFRVLYPFDYPYTWWVQYSYLAPQPNDLFLVHVVGRSLATNIQCRPSTYILKTLAYSLQGRMSGERQILELLLVLVNVAVSLMVAIFPGVVQVRCLPGIKNLLLESGSSTGPTTTKEAWLQISNHQFGINI